MAQVKRIVLFKFKSDTSETKIQEIFSELGGLKAKIPGIVDFTSGEYASSDGLNQGYTHAFIMTFENTAARDGFGPHAEHQRVVGILGPTLDSVLAFDFEA